MLSRISSVLLFLLLPTAGVAQSLKDWPTFRGNDAQIGVATGVLPDMLQVRWSFKAPTVFEASPIIHMQTVYIGGADGKLYALDLATGKKKWQYQASSTRASPAARDGAVYFGDNKGTFHCVDAVTGKQRWTVAARADIVSSANFASDRILFGSYDHHVYCLSTQGKILWQHRTKEKVHGSPAVVGNRVLVGGCDQSLYVIDVASGQELSVIPVEGHIAASIAVRGDHAYVGSMANQFLAVDWKKGNIAWQFEAKRNAQPFASSPAVTQELVIVGSRDKYVRAWQRQTGKEVWAFATQGRVDGSPVVAGKRVVVGSLDGHLYLLDLARGTEVARFDLGTIPATPAVADGCVVVATATGGVFCLGGK